MNKMLLAVLTALVLGQGPADPCATGESPCDPNRPWMRGRIEKSCAPRWYPRADGMTLLECACRHTCDPKNEYKDVTKNRGWDATCEARCSPTNCKCPHPCQQT